MLVQQPRLIAEEPPETAPAQPDAERAAYPERLAEAEKLRDPEFRKIEGFPIGDNEAILTLSDPPCYTACPNRSNPKIGRGRAQTSADFSCPRLSAFIRVPSSWAVAAGPT